jgi:hypothetical protein
MANVNMIPKEINFEDEREILLIHNSRQFSRQNNKVKEGKVYPITGHEDPEGK